MIIREATEADLAAMVALLADDPLGRKRETPGDPAYARAFAEMAATPGNTLLVAEEAGAVIGCLQLLLIPSLSRRGETRAEIEGVRVARSARGWGVGEALTRTALDRARAAGCGLAQLTSDRSRADAHRFYERLGFEATHVGYKLRL